MISKKQIRAARVLLEWSQEELAKHADISVPTLQRVEGNTKIPASEEAIEAVRIALENAGVEFIPENGGGQGVRLR